MTNCLVQGENFRCSLPLFQTFSGVFFGLGTVRRPPSHYANVPQTQTAIFQGHCAPYSSRVKAIGFWVEVNTSEKLFLLCSARVKRSWAPGGGWQDRTFRISTQFGEVSQGQGYRAISAPVFIHIPSMPDVFLVVFTSDKLDRNDFLASVQGNMLPFHTLHVGKASQSRKTRKFAPGFAPPSEASSLTSVKFCPDSFMNKTFSSSFHHRLSLDGRFSQHSLYAVHESKISFPRDELRFLVTPHRHAVMHTLTLSFSLPLLLLLPSC